LPLDDEILSQKSLSSQAAKLFHDRTLKDMHELDVQNQNPAINSFQYFRVRAGRAIQTAVARHTTTYVESGSSAHVMKIPVLSLSNSTVLWGSWVFRYPHNLPIVLRNPKTE
jgi:hypothetical protein